MNSKSFHKIWLAIILLAIVAGGILVWQYLIVPKEKHLTLSELIKKDETTNWEIYSDSKIGFTFKYPNSLSIYKKDYKEYCTDNQGHIYCIDGGLFLIKGNNTNEYAIDVMLENIDKIRTLDEWVNYYQVATSESPIKETISKIKINNTDALKIQGKNTWYVIFKDNFKVRISPGLDIGNDFEKIVYTFKFTK